MTRHRRWLLLLACIACALFVAPSARATDGVAPQKQGWWTTTNTPIPLGGAAEGAPDVAAGQLYVAGSSSHVTAVAALRYAIPAGATVHTLNLTIAPQTLTLPGSKLRACPLTGNRDFTAAEGAPMNDAPTWDCERAVPGELDPAGVAYQFAVAALVENGELAVAIVPAGTADRVVLAGPDPTALPVDEPVSSRPASPSRPAVSLPTATHGSTIHATPAAPTHAAPAPRSAPAAAPVAITPAASVQRDRVNVTGHGTAPPGAMLGALAIAALAIGVWWRGRQTLFGLTSGTPNSVS